MEKSSKEFLALMDAFCMFVVQQGEATTQNQETTKLMNYIVEGLNAISNGPSRGFAKATIKARLPNSFVGKETKTKRVQPWLHQIEAYKETYCLETNKEQIHFVQTLKKYTWEWWMLQKEETSNLFKMLTWGDFKLWLDGKFIPHHLVLRNGMEFLELTQGEDRGLLLAYVQDFNCMLIMVPLKDEYVWKLIFLHALKPWVKKIVYQKTWNEDRISGKPHHDAISTRYG